MGSRTSITTPLLRPLQTAYDQTRSLNAERAEGEGVNSIGNKRKIIFSRAVFFGVGVTDFRSISTLFRRGEDSNHHCLL